MEGKQFNRLFWNVDQLIGSEMEQKRKKKTFLGEYCEMDVICVMFRNGFWQKFRRQP